MGVIRRNRTVPKIKDGYLYYVRLKTEVGLLYKVGFTTSTSVEERFAYKGNGDEKYIDKTLLFLYLKDAYSVEQKLHMHFSGNTVFSRFSALKHMPLYKNGQTELYAKDVMNLDVEYSEQQAKQTISQIKEWRARQKYSHPAAIWLHAYGAETLGKGLGMVVFYALVYPIVLVSRLIDKEKDQALIKASRDESARRAKSVSELLSFIAAKKAEADAQSL